MSDIRDFVMAEPLVDNHEHQGGFGAIEARTSKLNYQEFVGYAGADMATAAGPAGHGGLGEMTPEQFFELWSAVRTTGYGQASELACRAILGLDYTAENVDAIADDLRALCDGKSGADIYDEMMEKAGIRWGLNDACWETPSPLSFFDGHNHPDGYRHMLRYDALLCLSTRGQVEGLGRKMDRAIHTLDGLNQALDDYTAEAAAKAKFGGFKAGMPYLRRLDFENSSYSEAERLFEDMMMGRTVELKPLHDYMFHRFVQRASDLGCPVQMHMGYLAGNWGDLRRCDPTHLMPILMRYKGVRFDLFHACWPYSEIAGTMGKEFPNVYLDMCWAWAMNPLQMERILDEWLSGVPNNRIFAYGGDTGSPFPMVGYALQAREGIARVLEAKVERGEYDEATAEMVARRIMNANARELYGLDD